MTSAAVCEAATILALVDESEMQCCCFDPYKTHCRAPEGDADARRRMQDRPVTVGVGHEFSWSTFLELNPCIDCLCHVCEHSICMLIHFRRGKGECASKNANRKGFAGSSTVRCVSQCPNL
eukprot:5840907-Pleurochrysis_carterae.AAC.1